jgi:arylsulfatase A-like enzyme
VLKRAGYATGLVGKWHLGMAPRFHPFKRGFEEFFGFLGGAHSYVDWKADAANPILRGNEPVDEPEYLTDALTREAIAFVERHQKHPFFLYLCYNAVHAPMHATQKYLDRFPNIADEKRRIHAAMLSAMDDGIGAVLAALRKAGVHENTMVFFISDNGGPTQVTTADNSPLRAVKGTVYEGGIRVPFILQWPRRFAGGRTHDQPVISLDIFSTAVAAGGGRLPKGRAIDGVDLLPCVTGRKKTPHDILFWRKGEDRAVRRGNWKLVKSGEQPAELYDLGEDISESKDLSAEKPEVVDQLSRHLAAWESQLVPPLWGPAAGTRQRAVPRTQGRRQGR